MKNFFSVLLILSALLYSACKSHYDCYVEPVQPLFIGYSLAEIDTLYLRQFEANTGYTTLLNTDSAFVGKNLNLIPTHDTTGIDVRTNWGILLGSDWELVIPAANKIIRFSNIMAEKRQGECTNGIFSLDKFGCSCISPLLSVEVNGQLVVLSNSNSGIYIRR